MSEPIPMLAAHPLVGTWKDSDPDGSTARFTIRPTSNGFSVSGEDSHDGEPFVISDVSWDGKVLRFVSRMASTAHVVEHEFAILDRDRVRHRYWLVEEWVRDTE
jgi:hypothetical protein